MEKRYRYGKYVIDARPRRRGDMEGWTCEFTVEEHRGVAVVDTPFCVPGVFPTEEAAISAALESGRERIEAGFVPRFVQPTY